MRKLYPLIFSFLAFLMIQIDAKAQICTYELPLGLATDTIYLDSIPVGIKNTYYEQAISFRLPKTTDPVAATNPDIPPGIPIDELEVLSLNNLPVGLNWETDQATYFPNTNPDGCMLLTGTPLVTGTFTIDVTVEATIAIIKQTTSFQIYMTIEPPVSNTEGFSIVNATACGELEASFVNQVPSTGQEGYSYSWDFGNGLNSTDENPPSQVYTEAGVYPIQYEAIIDTVGYILAQVTVQSASCDDLAIPFITDGSPELYINILNQNGTTIYTSDFQEDVAPPLAFNLDILMDEGNYTIEVFDEDSGLGFADDECGVINFNRETSGSITNGDLTLEFLILHPVDTIQSTDSVVVYPNAIPSEILVDGETTFCAGDSTILFANTNDQIQWYRDSLKLEGVTSNDLLVTETGNYWIESINENGCVAISEAVAISWIDLPQAPVFINTNNQLDLIDTVVLPENYSLQWYFDNTPLEEGITSSWCAQESGEYTLEVIDLETTCTSSFSINIAINPAFDCTLSTSHISAINGKIFPNPFRNELTIEGISTNYQYQLFDVNGRLVQSQENIKGTTAISTTHLNKGIYFIKIIADGNNYIEKLIK